MMHVLRAFVIAFSMYSKIPMPQIQWREKDMRYAICFFPFVGLVIAGLIWLWMLFCQRYEINLLAFSGILALIPLIITGGIHIDGFMDTSDALHSYQEKSRKLEILKDAHIGAFSVMMLAGYYLIYVSALSCITRDTAGILALGFCLSRMLSGASVVSFKSAKQEGTLYTFSSAAHKRAVRMILGMELLLCACFMMYINLVQGTLVLAVSCFIFLFYRYKSYREFGGITGDLAGWFLCLCEAGTAVVLALYGSLC